MRSSIDLGKGIVVPGTAFSVTTARSAGPGGQNVNKVSSKVDLRVDLEGIVGLDAGALARLRGLVRTKLDADGRLQIVSQKTRDQAKNLDDAWEKLRDLVERARLAPTPRRPTKPGRGAVRRRVEDKRRVGERKKDRSRGDEGR